MTALIKALYSLVGEYGITVVIAVCIMQLIVIPFEAAAKKNNAAKELAEPRIKGIRKKYGVNAMGGFDPALSGELDPAIRFLPEATKEKRMNEEIDGIYRETGYRPITGIVPALCKIVLVILLYIGINGACPDNVYRVSMMQPEAGVFHKIMTTTVMLWVIWFDAFVPYHRTVKTVPDDKLKSAVASILISAALAIGLTAWIVFTGSLATVVAVLAFHVTECIVGWIFGEEQKN